MSNSASFSYAQAAKGQSATVPPATASQSSSQSQAPSTTSTQSRDAVPTPSTRAPSVAISTTSNELDGSQNTGNSSVKAESVSLNSVDSDITSTSDKATELSGLQNQDAEKALGEVVPQSIERRGRGQTLTSQTTDGGDGKRGRKGKKSRATEKESGQEQDQEKKENLPPKPELSEAPVPAVNVWTQRQEARAAKIKTTPSTTTQPRSSSSATASQVDGPSNPTTQDQKQKASPSEGTEIGGTNSRPSSGGPKSKKDFDQFRSNGQGPRRAAPRGARSNGEERASFEALSPAATNTSSWPTPETAANGLKAQAQGGKSEKEQKDDSGPSKPRSRKEWQPIEFVPSVSFNTPIPSRGGSRGGRGGLRGGRDSTARGNHASSVSLERTQYNGAATGSATSAPAASKRASVDVSTGRDSRKPLAQAASGKASGEAQSAGSKADTSKQNQPDSAPNGTSNQNAPARVTSSNQRADDTLRSSQPARDGARDSNFQGQNSTGRSERVRGGGRGRGGHSTVNGAGHSQSQFGQGANGYNYPSNGNPRQNGHQYANGYAQMPYGGAYPAQTAGGQHRSRPSSGSNRAQHARHPSSRASPYPAMNMAYEAPVYPHGNGVYGGYTDPAHLLSGVLSQVEYYFSIDNLCKDTYLRRCMDSQGFVPLNVIASFKRMQEIADYQVIRIACDHSPHIEIVITDDGHDKVRRRENWEQWVLDIGTRFKHAQNDGPKSYRPINSQMLYYPQVLPYGGEAPPIFSPTNADAHFAPYLYGNGVTSPTSNGINGHTRPLDSQLSAAVPEFSPTGNATMGTMSQQGEAPSTSFDNGLASDNTDAKSTTLPTGEQVGSPLNGSHDHGSQEQVSLGDNPTTNGVSASSETEAY
ncbi:hypothetical protein F4774DRAFT_260292 [Daldinia eschscholtzii]|nr:hypothetical protein F4774DRAFT_260292 [Daldinia eschscholtzii]